ncbi:FUSC family protein [Dyella sp. RRB7]|uniref:FUSC family protein n=1 Tax=Dyella sp. RRB7 TaxID=2919502 RepID=UPI001FAA55E6|nr:FUSC family protein [Dyella sp. RRB7]
MSDKPPLRDNLRRLLDFQLDIEQIYRDQPWTHRILQGLWMALLALVAASAAYGLGLLLHAQQAFWAALTSIAVTQQTYLDTRASARDQIIGACVGGVVGLGAALLGGDHYIAYAIAIVVAITACWISGLGSAARLSASTTTIVMLVPHFGSFWVIALTRMGEVAVGIACALVVVGVAERIKLRWVGGGQRDA